MLKVLVVAVLVAAVNAHFSAPATLSYGAQSYYGSYGTVAAPAVTTHQSNVYRGYGNMGAVSAYSKTIDTPFSSVRKSNFQIHNPSYTVAASYAPIVGQAPFAVAAPAGAYAAAAPAVAAHGLLGVAYSAAPAVAHMAYNSPVGLNYAW